MDYLDVHLTSAYKKGFRRAIKRGGHVQSIKVVIDLLRSKKELPEKYQDHQLKGALKDYRECHIEPNWLLLYKVVDDTLYLAGTGTHADLFE